MRQILIADLLIRKRPVFDVVSMNQAQPNLIKAAYSGTFDLLILELMFLFFKSTVKKLKFRYTFYQFRKSKQIISIKTTAFTLKLPVYNYWRDANNYQHEKNTPVL